MIIIERATEDDLAAVLALDYQVTGNAIRQQILADAIQVRQCVVARRGGTPLGYLLVDRSFFGQYFIAAILVHPDQRRQGVATALVRHVEKTCPESRVFASAGGFDSVMDALYTKLGFVHSGHIDNLHESVPEIIYVKRLSR